MPHRCAVLGRESCPMARAMIPVGQYADGDGQQSPREAAGRILDPADHEGPGESSDIADGIDQCDRAGGGGAAQNGGRQRPENRHDGQRSGRSDRDGEHRQKRRMHQKGARGQTGERHHRGDGDMPHALLHSIRTAGPPHHGERAAGIGNGDGAADAAGGNAGVREDLRNPQDDAVQSEHHAEVARAQGEHPRTEQRLPQRGGMRSGAEASLRVELVGEPALLRGRQPACIGRPIGKIQRASRIPAPGRGWSQSGTATAIPPNRERRRAAVWRSTEVRRVRC